MSLSIHYIAQSGFVISDEKKVIAIDPWISNPSNPVDIEDVPKLDYILLTHDHADHGKEDALKISKKQNTPIITSFELANALKEEGAQTVGANPGGWLNLEDNFQVALTPANHSAEIGIPVGFVFKLDNKTIYHMGDTGLLAEVDMIGEIYNPQIVLVPIGSHFTAGIEEAVYMVEKLKPEIVIPMHYNTFPPIKQDPEKFRDTVQRNNDRVDVHIIKPSEHLTL